MGLDIGRGSNDVRLVHLVDGRRGDGSRSGGLVCGGDGGRSGNVLFFGVVGGRLRGGGELGERARHGSGRAHRQAHFQQQVPFAASLLQLQQVGRRLRPLQLLQSHVLFLQRFLFLQQFLVPLFQLFLSGRRQRLLLLRCRCRRRFGHRRFTGTAHDAGRRRRGGQRSLPTGRAVGGRRRRHRAPGRRDRVGRTGARGR